MDASLIRADVSMDALVARHLDAVEDANDVERTARGGGKYKKLCRTDPDATMATSSKAPLRPSYKQHTAVDDHAGVVVGVTPQACLRHDEIVTGEEHDTGRFEERLEVMENTLGAAPARVTVDAAYGLGKVYTALQTRQADAVIPPAKVTRRKGAQGLPTDRFEYDPHHDVVRCPARTRNRAGVDRPAIRALTQSRCSPWRKSVPSSQDIAMESCSCAKLGRLPGCYRPASSWMTSRSGRMRW